MPDDDHRARVRLAEACQRWSDDVARTHRIHVEERDFMPPGVVAFATPSERTVVVPPFSAALSEAVLLARLATRAHEFGHVIRGQCPGTWPHHGIMVKSWHNCLSCEIGAWNAAMGLISFGREMHQHLKRSLAIYRRDTPAPPCGSGRIPSARE
jgi:hypothetical protein